MNRLQQRGETRTCPVCHGEYELDYPTEDQAPRGTIGREQHESGICSRACLLASDKEAIV